MKPSISSTAKRRGRPKTTGPGEQVKLTLHDPLLSEIDAYAAAQGDTPLRPEAIRRLTEAGLTQWRRSQRKG